VFCSATLLPFLEFWSTRWSSRTTFLFRRLQLDPEDFRTWWQPLQHCATPPFFHTALVGCRPPPHAPCSLLTIGFFSDRSFCLASSKRLSPSFPPLLLTGNTGEVIWSPLAVLLFGPSSLSAFASHLFSPLKSLVVTYSSTPRGRSLPCICFHLFLADFLNPPPTSDVAACFGSQYFFFTMSGLWKTAFLVSSTAGRLSLPSESRTGQLVSVYTVTAFCVPIANSSFFFLSGFDLHDLMV